MTSRQQSRLDRAERLCHLVMRHQSCGLVEREGYCPDVVSALHFMQVEGEKQGSLKSGSLHWLGDLAEQIRAALFSWMDAVGLDPKSYEKQATQRMAMEMAQSALGPEYEGEVEQIGEGKRMAPWVEKTADERAWEIIADFAGGKVRSHEELRLAVAAEILEAEQRARHPFCEYARAIFQVCEDARGQDQEAGERLIAEAQEQMKTATINLLAEASRWIDLQPKAPVEAKA